MRRPATLDELGELAKGISSSFVHLETRDAYGTETELPHLAKWRRGEPDDLAWCEWYFDMLRGHRAAGRRCRRLRVASEPVSEYQRWVNDHVGAFIEAGEENYHISRQRLTDVWLPGSGDFYVFDDALVFYLHYAGSGLNTSCEITDDPEVVKACRDVFEDVWKLAEPIVTRRSD